MPKSEYIDPVAATVSALCAERLLRRLATRRDYETWSQDDCAGLAGQLAGLERAAAEVRKQLH